MDIRSIQKEAIGRLMSAQIVEELTEGRISVEQYAAYISDVYSYALHSSQVIALAGSRLALSHPPLAQYLYRHAEEELGHDKWAASDLQDLGLSPAEIAKIVPSSACLRMIGVEYYYAAHANPIGLFGWLFVLESLGGAAGGKIAGALDHALRLNGKATYFLRGHGDADAQHSEDLCSVIQQNLNSPEDIDTFLLVAAESEALYAEILDHALDIQQNSARAAYQV